MEFETQQEQATPEVQARISASFERQGFMRHLGARLTHIAPGRVHVVLPSRAELTQQHGYFHAGATSAIADSAGGYAAFTLFPEYTTVLTVEYKIYLLAPAVGDHLEAWEQRACRRNLFLQTSVVRGELPCCDVDKVEGLHDGERFVETMKQFPPLVVLRGTSEARDVIF